MARLDLSEVGKGPQTLEDNTETKALEKERGKKMKITRDRRGSSHSNTEQSPKCTGEKDTYGVAKESRTYTCTLHRGVNIRFTGQGPALLHPRQDLKNLLRGWATGAEVSNTTY